jgi:hypothetical protein
MRTAVLTALVLVFAIVAVDARAKKKSRDESYDRNDLPSFADIFCRTFWGSFLQKSTVNVFISLSGPV